MRTKPESKDDESPLIRPSGHRASILNRLVVYLGRKSNTTVTKNSSVISPQPKKDYMNTPTVLVTGALTGIGRATALAFAHEGARVVVSGRHDNEGQKLATELRKLGTEAEFLRTDVPA